MQRVGKKLDQKGDGKKNTPLNLSFPAELVNEIDKFKTSYNFTNRTDAIRFLVTVGLKNMTGESKE